MISRAGPSTHNARHISNFHPKTRESTMTTPVQLVQKFYTALSTGDIPTILTVLDPDLEWTEAERFPY